MIFYWTDARQHGIYLLNVWTGTVEAGRGATCEKNMAEKVVGRTRRTQRWVTLIVSLYSQTNLQTFKQDTVVGVLLLPLQTGSNGLNIIEATHVLLVEPALNPAHELQAVGRVHRIGQTKWGSVVYFFFRFFDTAVLFWETFKICKQMENKQHHGTVLLKFRYSFFRTIPNFLNLLLDKPLLVRSTWNLQYLMVFKWI